MRGPDAGTLFARALIASAAQSGITARGERMISVPYASATYTGSTERIGLVAPADTALDTWLAGLADADLPMRRHVVVHPDIVEDVRSGGVARLVIAALVLDKD